MVEVHPRAHRAVGINDIEEVHVRMPGVHAPAFDQAHAEHTLGHGEQALHHRRQREVGLEVFLAEAEALLAQFFRAVGDVPGLQLGDAELAGGKLAQFGQFAQRHRPRLGGQFAQETQHTLGRAGHLVGKRHMGAGGEVEQQSGFVPQRKDLLDALAVVVRAGAGALVGGAGVVGGVDLFAQGAGVGEGQDGLHHRTLERGQVAVELFLLRHRAQHGAGRVGQAGQLGLGHRPGPGVGGVEHGLFEFGFELAQFVLDGLEARTRRLLQRHAGEPEAAQAVFDDGAAGAVERGETGGLVQGLHRGVELAVLAQLGAVFGQFFQRGGIGFAQLGRILDAVQVRHRRETAAEFFLPTLQRRHQRGEIARGRIGGEAVDFGAECGQHLVDGGIDVLRRDGGEGGQLGIGEQGIGRGHGLQMAAVPPGFNQRVSSLTTKSASLPKGGSKIFMPFRRAWYSTGIGLLKARKPAWPW